MDWAGPALHWATPVPMSRRSHNLPISRYSIPTDYKNRRLSKNPLPLPIPSKVPIKPVMEEETQTPLVMEQTPIPCQLDTEISPSNGFQKDIDDHNEQSTVDEDSTDDELDKVEDPWPWRVEPALQVLSVAIFKPDHLDSRVGGEITITDHNMKKKYYIYKGDKDKLKPGWNGLVLTRGPVASVMGGYIEFELTSEDGTVPIFNHAYDMNKAMGDSRDRKFTLEGDGNCGYRCNILFTKTAFAAIAKVADMFVLPPSTPPPGKENYQLHGKISVNSIGCFEIKREEALTGKYVTETRARNGTYELKSSSPFDNNVFVIPVQSPFTFGDKLKISFPIHNTVYVVPVDSPLTIDVELYCDGLVITNRRFELNACNGIKYPSFECETGGFVFHVEVHWMIPYHFFDEDVQLISSPTYPRNTKSFGLPVSGALVEVFSVFFGGSKSATPCIDLYGAVVVIDGDNHFNILTGKKDLPCKLPSSSQNDEHFRTLPLKWPDDRWVVGENFGMHFKFKDGKNNLLCVGLISWMRDIHSRYDMRLCDVFQGENGYLVAVHYSVFKNGKKAKVYVECSNGPYSIYGSVFAQYDNYDYSSTYEKQCCRSMLFRRSEELPLLAKYCQIPLLKSQVSAPSECNELNVCVDLWVRPLSATFPHKQFTFTTNGTESCDMIWGSLMVKVEWICG